MLHSLSHNKSAGEDRKTSSVFESLLLLPDGLFWQILRESCSYHSSLPQTVGSIIDYDFWPSWDAAGTKNSLRVEPDVFIRTLNFDLIIEAKRGDRCGQYEQQWKNEVTAYRNMYGDEEQKLVLIAVGGNNILENHVLGKESVTVYRCSWQSILSSVSKYYHIFVSNPYQGDEIRSLIRIFEHIILAFELNGVYHVHWLEELTKLDYHIDDNSIEILRNNYIR